MIKEQTDNEETQALIMSLVSKMSRPGKVKVGDVTATEEDPAVALKGILKRFKNGGDR
jgi:hypothetical protein